jgi:hypothetical protein
MSHGLHEPSSRDQFVALDSKIRHIVLGEGLGDTISNSEELLVVLVRVRIVGSQQDMIRITQELEVEQTLFLTCAFYISSFCLFVVCGLCVVVLRCLLVCVVGVAVVAVHCCYVFFVV